MTFRCGRPNYLFSEGEFFSVVEGRKRQTQEWVDSLDADYTLSVSLEDICSYAEEEYALDTPILNHSDAVAYQREAQVEVHDAFRRRIHDDGPLVVIGTEVNLEVPFTGHGELFRVLPSTYNCMPPIGRVNGHNLVLSISGTSLDEKEVGDELRRQIDNINQYLGWLRSSTDAFNSTIREMVRAHFERRKQKLIKDRSLVSGLGFKLKERTGSTRTFAAPVNRKRLKTSPPPAGKAPFKPEPVLEEGEYSHILDLMTNMTLVMERSPKAFTKMGEEDLRQHFLVHLNGVYEGQATGETFNYEGKTDILIRVDAKNIFIAECKFWRGETCFRDTIDQILSYLSWRDTKACIALFSRNKRFTDVLGKMRAAADNHPGKKSGPEHQSETRFRYVFGHKDDPSREIVLTVLAFDVPSEDAS